MPTRKLSSPETWIEGKKKVKCTDREHNPPNQMVFEPGSYEHTCPDCGKATTFIVSDC
jgi:ribosomal protein S27E